VPARTARTSEPAPTAGRGIEILVSARDPDSCPEDDLGFIASNRRRLVYARVWLIFLAFPLIAAVGGHRPLWCAC
jgi:hypothetical protein